MNTFNSPAGASGTNDSYTLPAQTKERPILFSGAMVRAILDGKTQTRRVIKPQPIIKIKNDHICDFEIEKGERYAAGINVEVSELAGNFKGIGSFCPYGKIGDRLWVRETFCPNYFDEPDFTTAYKADYTNDIAEVVQEPKWKPSIHMPRKLSRINLEITDIRVERIQDISDNDIESEGVEVFGDSIVRKTLFTDLWNKINKKRGCGWDKNPWVWVVTFKRV